MHDSLPTKFTHRISCSRGSLGILNRCLLNHVCYNEELIYNRPSLLNGLLTHGAELSYTKVQDVVINSWVVPKHP